jgi:hypothetical protein
MHTLDNLIEKRRQAVEVIDFKSYAKAQKKFEKILDKLWLNPLKTIGTNDNYVAKLAAKYGLTVSDSRRSDWRKWYLSIPGKVPLRDKAMAYVLKG